MLRSLVELPSRTFWPDTKKVCKIAYYLCIVWFLIQFSCVYPPPWSSNAENLIRLASATGSKQNTDILTAPVNTSNIWINLVLFVFHLMKLNISSFTSALVSSSSWQKYKVSGKLSSYIVGDNAPSVTVSGPINIIHSHLMHLYISIDCSFKHWQIKQYSYTYLTMRVLWELGAFYSRHWALTFTPTG